MKLAITVLALTIGIVIAGAFIASKNSNQPSSKYEAFAKCLAERQFTMYGSKTCSHCNNEKERFEGSFKYVPYVECSRELKRCIDAGVEGYPTWILPDGRKLVGEQGLEKLSEESGCVLPTN